MSPEEFVELHRGDPLPILDFLRSAELKWLEPRLARCRSILRNWDERPGDSSHLAGALAELGQLLLKVPPPTLAEVAGALEGQSRTSTEIAGSLDDIVDLTRQGQRRTEELTRINAQMLAHVADLRDAVGVFRL